jgi:eukaryotic-like serine/threonine-protein kinase
MQPTPGALVADRVRLERPLAAGAMGAVWVGRHLALDVDVAVKFIKSEELRDDLRARGRFEREARAAARIKSPHVVQIFDCGITDDGTPYLVMELLEGETLKRRLERSGALPPDEVAAIVTQVCRALGRAHALGIVHRDVKPENLFLLHAEQEPFVKLLDFGIAKQAEMPPDAAATQSGVLVGSPQYMSPEQLLRPKQADFRADLWALAVVAYQALCGRPPFVGDTVAGLIVAITQGKFTRISTLAPELPTALDAWFDRALCLEPEARFDSAAELGESLPGALGLPPSAQNRLSRTPASDPDDEAAPSAAADASSDTAAFVAKHLLGVGSEPSAPGSATASSDGNLLAPTRRSGPSLPPSDEAAPGGARATRSSRWGWLAVAAGAAAVAALVVFGELGPGRRTSATTASGAASGAASATAPTAASVGGSGTSAMATGASAAPKPTDASSATAGEPGAPLAPLAPTEIEPGAAPEVNAWLPKFKIVRHDGDQGQSYLAAMDACREHALALCTEAQWLRACELVPALGAMESWTASPSGEHGFVVRGGPRGCASRQVVGGAEPSAQRVGACCERVVAMADDSANRNFLRSTSSKLLAYERASDAGDLISLSNLLDSTIEVQHGGLDRERFIEQVRRRLAKVKIHWVLHDLCEARLTTVAGDPAWTADCRTLVREDDKLTYVLRRYLFGGPEGKLQTYLEPKILRAAAEP